MKLRQLSYKKELDQQFQELQARKKGSMSEQHTKEEGLIKYQQKLVEQRALQEEAKRKKMMDNEKKDAMAGFSELQNKRKQDQMMKDMEREMHKQKIQLEQKIQSEREYKDKMKKKEDENQYYQMLTMQTNWKV